MRDVHQSLRLWDLPTRLFHWSLVVLIGTAWLSGEQGWMDIHEKAGIGVFTLVLFRLIWGVVGSDSAKFVKFVKLTQPRQVIRHLKILVGLQASHGPCPGHNPAGGLMVVALLIMAGFQALSGMGSVEDTYLFYEGPLVPLVGPALSSFFTSIHETSFNILLGLVALHVAVVVLLTKFRGQDLIKPMLVGTKRVAEPFWERFTRLQFVHPIRAAVSLAAAAGIVAGLILVAS